MADNKKDDVKKDDKANERVKSLADKVKGGTTPPEEPKEPVNTPAPIDDFEEKMTKQAILAEFEAKQNKPKIEDTHVRRTFLIDRNLDARLTALAGKKGHGFKTFFINQIIADALKNLED